MPNQGPTHPAGVKHYNLDIEKPSRRQMRGPEAVLAGGIRPQPDGNGLLAQTGDGFGELPLSLKTGVPVFGSTSAGMESDRAPGSGYHARRTSALK